MQLPLLFQFQPKPLHLLLPIVAVPVATVVPIVPAAAIIPPVTDAAISATTANAGNKKTYKVLPSMPKRSAFQTLLP